MIFMVYTKDLSLKVPDPFKRMLYLEVIEAVSGHEACKKVKKEHPDREFINWWKKE